MPEPIYTNTVDQGRFNVRVEETDNDYRGTLVVCEGDVELARESVSVDFGAYFGPDSENVRTWQLRAIEVIDAHLIDRGELIPAPVQAVTQPRRRKKEARR